MFALVSLREEAAGGRRQAGGNARNIDTAHSLVLLQVFPVAFCAAGAHLASIFSMNLGAVSFAQIVKASEPAFAAIVGTSLYGKSISKAKWLCLIPVIGGVCLASIKELGEPAWPYTSGHLTACPMPHAPHTSGHLTACPMPHAPCPMPHTQAATACHRMASGLAWPVAAAFRKPTRLASHETPTTPPSRPRPHDPASRAPLWPMLWPMLWPALGRLLGVGTARRVHRQHLRCFPLQREQEAHGH